jgi:hypothetical protein
MDTTFDLLQTARNWVVISKSCSLAMAPSQPVENQQRLYEVVEKKHDMECTTFSMGGCFNLPRLPMFSVNP